MIEEVLEKRSCQITALLVSGDMAKQQQHHTEIFLHVTLPSLGLKSFWASLCRSSYILSIFLLHKNNQTTTLLFAGSFSTNVLHHHILTPGSAPRTPQPRAGLLPECSHPCSATLHALFVRAFTKPSCTASGDVMASLFLGRERMWHVAYLRSPHSACAF